MNLIFARSKEDVAPLFRGLDLDVVLCWGFGWKLPQEALDSYDATLMAFQRSEKIKEVGWTGAMKNRWRDAKSINGRDKIRSALISLGFKLD